MNYELSEQSLGLGGVFGIFRGRFVVRLAGGYLQQFADNNLCSHLASGWERGLILLCVTACIWGIAPLVHLSVG